jgi:hypothetical protein
VTNGVIDLAERIRIPLGAQRSSDAAGPYRSINRVVGAHLVGLPDGPYRFGIRASDCPLVPAEGDVAVKARVELSEISGSETFVYLRGTDAPTQFVVQRDGVFHHQLDDELTFYLDPDRLLAFAAGGDQQLVASYHAQAELPTKVSAERAAEPVSPPGAVVPVHPER